MDIFEDGFDMEDAAILGGIIGFAEDSMKAEEEDLEEIAEEKINIDPSEIKEANLKLIYNMNPDLFNHIVNIVKKQNIKWKKDRIAREAVKEELEALEESKEILENIEAEDDN
jgi:hypothetical protein